jgi:hypothetical protein
VATEGESENARISAAIALLDRAFGKPAQSAAAAMESDTPESTQLSLFEAGRRIAYVLQRARNLEN